MRSWFDPKRSGELMVLAGPIILGMASQTVTNLVDTAMVGRLGAAAQGAAGLGSFAFWVAANLIIAVGTGVQVTASRRDGEGRPEGAGAALDTGLVLATVVGLPLGWFMAQGAGSFFGLLSDDPEVVVGGSAYLAIRLLGIGAVAANYSFRGFYNGIGRSTVYLSSLLLIHGSNIFLNWVFIYGNLGSRPMGVQGAALASVLAAVIGVVFYSCITLVRPELREKYRPFRFTNIRPDTVLGLLKLAWPDGLRGIAMMTGFLLFGKLHSLLGTAEIAAGTVLINLTSVVFLPALGMGLACSTMVGRHLGRKDPQEARRMVWLGVRLVIALLTVPATVALLFTDPVLTAFTPDPEVVAAATPALRLFAAASLVDAVPMVLAYSLVGAGATRFVAGLQVVQQYALLLPLGWLLGLVLGWGVFGLWLGMVLSRLIIGVVAWRKFAGDSWTSIDV